MRIAPRLVDLNVPLSAAAAKDLDPDGVWSRTTMTSGASDFSTVPGPARVIGATKALQASGVPHEVGTTFVVCEPSEIVRALVGLKDVRALYYERRGRQIELVIEQVVTDPRCPGCGGRGG